jgi:hypothetical protein
MPPTGFQCAELWGYTADHQSCFIIQNVMWPGQLSQYSILLQLNGPGIESQWEARFYAPVQSVPGAHWACYKMGAGLFPTIKQPTRGIDHPPTSRAEVKERVELHLYSPCGSSKAVLGRTLTFIQNVTECYITVHWCPWNKNSKRSVK